MYLLDVTTTQAANSNIFVLGLPLSDFINSIIAIVAVLGFLASLWYNRKTLVQTKELNDKTLKETEALYNKSLQVDLFDKKYSMIIYFMDFFRINRINKPADEQLSEFIRNCYLAFIFEEFKCIGVDFGKYANSFAPESEPLPDYRKDLKEASKVDVQDIYTAFCDYMEVKLRDVYVEFIKKIR